jgi:hypothetical protein
VTGLVVGVRPFAAAQSDSVKAAVEVAAVRYITKQVGNTKGVTIDPAYAKANDAPGKATATRRNPARSDSVAHAVSGTVSSNGSEHGVHVILSSPVFRKDTATITVTGTYLLPSTPPIRGVQTFALAMVLDHGSWVVVKAAELGK